MPFLVQHLDMNPAHRHGANWTKELESLEQAQVAADEVWLAGMDARQEITDTETGERWFRADGESGWHHLNVPQGGDANETAARVVRETTERGES